MFLHSSLVVSNPGLESFTTGCTGAKVFHSAMTYMPCLVVSNVEGVEGVVYCTEKCCDLFSCKIVATKEGSCL